MSRIVPYPHPDYSDPDLLAKEQANGSFAAAILDEVRSFRPVMERYEGSLEARRRAMILRGRYGPQSVDIAMHSMGSDFTKQLAWLPVRLDGEAPEPEVVYDPKRYYRRVEYRGYSLRDTGATFVKDLYCSTPYYDRHNPGLFGAKFVKDADGNIVRRFAAFVSLLDFAPSVLGEWPPDVNFDSRTYIGYVKGYAVYRCYVSDTEDELISFGLDGSVHRFGPAGSQCRPLGDYGCLVVASAGKTLILDGTLTPVFETDGDRCGSKVTEATAWVPCPFGIKIGESFYYIRDEASSWKYTRTKTRWHISVKKRPVWMYSKRVKYDYVTDNWTHEPLKALGWNLIRRGLYVPSGIPTKKAQLKSSDNYGDFIQVEENGKRELYQSFDFRRWNKVTDPRAADRFYGMMGRIWIAPGLSDIAGMMPYTISFFDHGDKMLFQYDGFVFSMS